MKKVIRKNWTFKKYSYKCISIRRGFYHFASLLKILIFLPSVRLLSHILNVFLALMNQMIWIGITFHFTATTAPRETSFGGKLLVDSRRNGFVGRHG